MSTNQTDSKSWYRWVILAFAVSSFLMTFVSRFAWPSLVPVIAPVMNISMTEAMAYMTAFYIGYVIMQIPGGILADRFGPRLVLTLSLCVQGLGTLGIGFIESYAQGFALRVLCGLGAGCVFSSCLKAVVTWFPLEQRGFAVGLVMTAPAIGIAVPNFIMPVLNGFIGWQGAFRSVGILILCFAAALAIFMRDRKNPAAGPRKSFLAGLKFVLSNRNTLVIAFLGFTTVWCQIGFGSVGNPYMTEILGLSVAGAGYMMMGYGLLGIPASALTGYVSAGSISKKKRMVIMSHCVLAALFFVFGRVGGFIPVLVTACLIGIFVACVNALSSILLADSAGPEWAATAAGVGNCIFQIGALSSPLVIGIARDGAGHYAWTWWILGIGAIAGIFIVLLVKDRNIEVSAKK